jgi:hypothetical protein
MITYKTRVYVLGVHTALSDPQSDPQVNKYWSGRCLHIDPVANP